MPKRILVVEDDPDNRRIVAKVLSVEGYHVIEAIDGIEALARARAERPDLILMDLALPNVDGWEATRQLKSDPETRSIPVVALTAVAMRGDEEQARAAGCDDYLPKPARPAAIRAVVKKYTGGPTP
ncbi:MAG: response regulator [Candidatus Binatia bacterium]|jgi:two-component system, cell cycle response regulator DivK